MADTALTAPFTFSGVTGAGLSPNLFVDAQRFYDRNVEIIGRFHQQLGLRSVMIGQQGVKSTRFGNAEHPSDFAMQDLSSEFEVPAEIGQTVGYDSVTIAAKGLAISDSYDKHMFGTQQLVNDTGVMRLLQSPASPVLAKLSDMVMSAIAGISAVSGTTSAELNIDTLLEALAAFSQVAVADNRISPGNPVLILHSAQVTQLQESIRTEPGFQYTGQSMGMQGIISPGAYLQNFMGLGIDLYVTNDVTTSGPAYQGALVDRGTIIVGFGDPSPVLPVLSASGLRYLAMPDLGMLLQQDATTLRQRKVTFQLYAQLGAAMGDLNVGRQRRIQSTT